MGKGGAWGRSTASEWTAPTIRGHHLRMHAGPRRCTRVKEALHKQARRGVPQALCGWECVVCVKRGGRGMPGLTRPSERRACMHRGHVDGDRVQACASALPSPPKGGLPGSGSGLGPRQLRLHGFRVKGEGWKGRGWKGEGWNKIRVGHACEGRVQGARLRQLRDLDPRRDEGAQRAAGRHGAHHLHRGPGQSRASDQSVTTACADQ